MVKAKKTQININNKKKAASLYLADFLLSNIRSFVTNNTSIADPAKTIKGELVLFKKSVQPGFNFNSSMNGSSLIHILAKSSDTNI